MKKIISIICAIGILLSLCVVPTSAESGKMQGYFYLNGEENKGLIQLDLDTKTLRFEWISGSKYLLTNHAEDVLNKYNNYTEHLANVEKIEIIGFESLGSSSSLQYAKSFKEIYFDKSMKDVTFWSNNCFFTYPSVEKISFDPQNETYKAIDGIAFTKDGKNLLYYPRQKTDTILDLSKEEFQNVNLPMSIKNNNLIEVILPETFNGSITVSGNALEKIYVYSKDASIHTDHGSTATIYSYKDSNMYYLCLQNGIRFEELNNSLDTEGTWSEQSTLEKTMYWKFDVDNQTLYLSGNGEFAAFKENAYPWLIYFSKIEKIVISNGVTSIPVEAFIRCNIKEIIIPKSIVKIAFGAFLISDVEKIYYQGSREQWNAIEVSDENEAINDAEIHYNYNLNKDFENITFSNKTYSYNGTEQAIAISGTLPEGATVTYTNEKGTNVGTYNATAVIKAEGYNTLTLKATMTITPASIAIKAKDVVIKIGATLPAFDENSYEITSGKLYGNDKITGALATNCKSTSVVKDFNITKGTLTAGANYNMTFTNGVLKVVDKTPQQITVSDITAKTYGDAPFTVIVTPDEASGLTAFTFASSNPAVATIDGSGNITIKGAGTTDITVSQAGNADYAPFERKQTLIVNKVAITVTADAKTKKIGTDDPALTYTYTGTLVGDDAFSGALSRKSGETIGRYDILQGSLTLGANYAITYQKAIFEIVDKTPQNIVVADIPAKTYGDAPFALEVTPDSTANLTAFTYTSGDETVATVDAAGNVTIVGAGETTITVAEPGNADYAAFSVGKALVVGKKAVTVASVNLDEKTAVLEGVLPADTAVELDFAEVALEIAGTVDETTSAVTVSNFVLKGEKAENYIVSTESLAGTVTMANTVSVNTVAENGTAIGTGTYLKGSNVTVSATANSGYKFAGWYVSDEKISTSAEYTFTADSNIELEAKFTKKSSGGGGATLPGAQKPAEPTPVEPSEPADDPVSGDPIANGAAAFTDVDKAKYDWAYEGIDALAKAGVFKGMTPTTFGPELTTTNAQVIALAVRIAGLKADGATTNLVAGDHWVYAEMAAAEKAGILGIFGGKVATEEATTREVAFTLLYNALKAAGVVLPETAEAIEYTDASSIDPACVEAITALTKAGIVNGMGDGTLAPKATITRAQLAKILGIAQTLIK